MIKLKENENFWLRRFVDINGIRTVEQKYKAIEKVVSNRLFASFERNLAVVQAILDGKWEVEETLYYVRNKKGILLLQKFQNEIIPVNHDFIRAISYSNGAIAQSYQITRQEIIDYDPRYLEFLEEVE